MRIKDLPTASGLSVDDYVVVNQGTSTPVTRKARVSTFLQYTSQNTLIIDIAAWGAVGDGLTDDTLAIQAAINYYSNLAWTTNTVYELGFTSGKKWKISSLVLKYGVSLIFNRGTVIVATSAQPAVFTIAAGPVNYVRISGMQIEGNAANVGQHCFYLYAQPQAAAPYDGGMWLSQFERCTIKGFTGHAFWFRGGPTSGPSAYLLPFQWISFRDVHVYRPASSTARCLLMTGQNDQFTFDMCTFDGPSSASAGCNIELSCEFQNGSVIGGFTVGGTQNPLSGDGPINIAFNGVTSQNSEYALRMYYSHDVNWSNGWLENIKYGFNITGVSTGITIANNHLANTGSDGLGTGYAVGVIQNSVVNTRGNTFVGAIDYFASRLDTSAAAVITSGDTTYNLSMEKLTPWTYQNTNQYASAATLDLGPGTSFLINTGNPGTTITNIKSMHAGQQLITLKAWGNTINNEVLILGTGGNISIFQPIVLRHMDTVTLQQYDLGPMWTVVGSNIRPSNSSSQPTTGYWTTGEFVRNNTPSTSGGLSLWGWSRLTTGSNHVTAVDWQALYATIGVTPTPYYVTQLTLNDSSPTACTNNAGVINAVISSLAAGTLGSTQIVFPDGIVYLDQQFVWTAPPAISGTLSSFSTPVAIWPEFCSNGVTTFVYKGAALAPTTSGYTGIGFWIFKGNGASQNARLRLKNLRFVNNNGISVTKTTLTSAVNVADVSVNVSGTPAVVGDAIAIQCNTVSGMVLTPQWWGTVTAVSGTGPQTVTFAAASTRNAFAYSGAGGTATGSIGNVVNVFKQSRAVQVGGYLSGYQDVFFFTEIINCEFMDWLSGIAFNDCTWIRTEKCSFTRTMFGIEQGYNNDLVEHYMPNLICQAASRSGCVVTSGSATFTTPSDMRGGWFPGMGIVNYTSSTSTATVTFPEEAVIVSLTATTVTMSHAAQQSGTFTLIPCIGTLVTTGEGTSPFYPVQPAPYNNGNRADADMIRIIEGGFAESRMIYHSNAGTNGTILVEDCYPEICQRIAFIGTASNFVGGGPYIFNRMKVQTPDSFTGPAIEGGNGGGLRIKVTDLQAGGAASNFAWFKQKGSTSQLIEWERNACTSVAGVAIIQPDVNFGQNVLTPSSTDICRFCMSDPGLTGYTKNLSTTGLSGTIASSIAEVALTDGLMLYITGNATLPNISLWTPRYGSKLKIWVQASAAWTFTFGSSYVNAAGTAIGTVTATGTFKWMYAEFVADGSLGVGRWILTSGTPAFI